ncbi:OsmC family protein [Mycolicibacterium parafortuitum]|uniref:OsmC/Ohr family protein [Dickeya dadantii 3937] n=1 Tax=Mycolicibacterium parafortuitum TaxID=39692 RepID=A0A375YK18_MYCPF|nr:OsmC family protein [Mycolicibacterium parafortuitum]ORB25302.1 peroxiredoxin [Mycolicibacterium parafortuitum]SRX81485.1 OsmC/Ohr family protein [Dickeya dadantii 3937] [Mycolicibacterium parafortuitum]
MTRHSYEVSVTWTGNQGAGTRDVRSYSRDHVVGAHGRAPIDASSDPAFRGDPARWNPEQLYVASIAQCHMLWYLHLAAAAGVTVVGYEDRSTAVMVEEPGGAGRFESVTLNPVVTIVAGGDAELAERLHHRVGDYCFIARSVNTPIHHRATIRTATA